MKIKAHFHLASRNKAPIIYTHEKYGI